jgi:NADH-quinone oxidoreductase subunit K
MIVPYSHVIVLAGIVFLMGMFCAVTRRNLIMILLGLEIMLNSAAIAFIGAALRWHHLEGQAIAIFILAIAAAEVSVGLALIVCAYRRKKSIDPGVYGRQTTEDG